MVEIAKASLELSIVTYFPSQVELDRLARSVSASLAEVYGNTGAVVVRVLDNSGDAAITDRIRAVFASAIGLPHTCEVTASQSNLGFGGGHNDNLARSRSTFILLLNQDIELEAGALNELLVEATVDAPAVAAWEMRQIPYEHPKYYDPVTLDTSWVSGAATLFRRDAMNAVAGFDRHIFMYGEDVDLSWRLRADGWRIRYMPRCGVIHRTYAVPGEVKRMQVLGGTLTNLCLRVRYGGIRHVAQGISMLLAEMLVPQAFAGRRVGLFQNLFRFAAKVPHFWRTRIRPSREFRAHFSGWDYELRRDGAFFQFPSRSEWPGPDAPLVSVLIRTIGRHAWLREALTSVANQTYPSVEIVLVEDGPATCMDVVAEFSSRVSIRYEALGKRCGRSVAGNRALALATGEWMGFLDDDDQFFADHVEVCLYSALQNKAIAVYAIAWETHTRTHDRELAHYTEELHIVRHSQAFDRVMLWHHNYLPIQTVLFHRQLYEKHGGLSEDMDQLEDWNLWTRYSLEDDFLFIPKVTSKYRVPIEQHSSVERQKALDDAYQDAVNRQATMQFTTNPRAISAMVENHVAARSLMRLEIPHPRYWSRRAKPLAWLYDRRQTVRRVLRKLKLSR